MNKTRQNAIVYIGALILLFYPLRHAFEGLDLMDAGYSLGNYQYIDKMNETWKFATYLANVFGWILTMLPFGDTWIGMNVYTGLLIGVTAAAVFLFFASRGDKAQTVWWEKYILFAAEFMALSLCWAPSVILYHYMGYLMMTATSLLLYQAIVRDNRNNYIISGVILGLCVAVRMPNITYMALIVPVWYSCFFYRSNESKKSEASNAKHSILEKRPSTDTRFRMLINHTILCMAGYFIGVFVPIAYISIRYGGLAYPNMVHALFGMTDTATDYKPTSMITAMFGDYISYSFWLFLFLAYMAVGIVVFSFAERRSRRPHAIVNRNLVLKICYVPGVLVLLRLCYGRGMFDFDYTAYFSMYKWVTVYLLVVIGLCIWCLVCKCVCKELKLWAVFLLVIIFITPLGSNNGLYPIMNNLFLVAPVSAFMILEALRQSKRLAGFFAFRFVLGILVACTVLQSVLFGIFFVFHDAQPIEEASREGRLAVSLQSSSKVNGIRTTMEKKEQLEALDQFLFENGFTADRLILYGDIPALAYIFDMEPAIFTTWPDLDSNPLERLQQDLDSINGDMPVVILGAEAAAQIDKQKEVRYKKFAVIQEFMLENQYKEVYSSDDYKVFACTG